MDLKIYSPKLSAPRMSNIYIYYYILYIIPYTLLCFNLLLLLLNVEGLIEGKATPTYTLGEIL